MITLITRPSKIFSENISTKYKNMTSQRQNKCLYHFCMGVYVYFFKKNVIMYARPIQVQKEVHFKKLQFLVVTYDMGFLRCAIGVVKTIMVYFLCLSNL